MANVLQLPTPIATTVGVSPNLKFMITADSLSALTTAGYLNQVSLEGYPIASTDIILAYSNFDIPTQSGDFGIFTVSISGASSTITLTEWANAGNIVLPVTIGDLPSFASTGGLLSDSGIAVSNLVKLNTSNALTSAGSLTLAKSTLVLTGPTGTLNAQAGIITTEALTTANGSVYEVTLTNSFATASSIAFAQWRGGTSSQNPGGLSFVVTPSAGSIKFIIQNITAIALNGTVQFSFVIF